MSDNNVLVEKREGIGFITLNRPQAMNTFNVPFARELNDALWAMEKDPEIRVVVIDANGKHFSTGIALDEFKGKNRQRISRIHSSDGRTQPYPGPDEKAGDRLGQGLCPGQRRRPVLCLRPDRGRGGRQVWDHGHQCGAYLPGAGRAPGPQCRSQKDSRDGAHRGYHLGRRGGAPGLVNKVVPPDKLEEATLELARKLAAKSPLALQIGKAGVYGMMDVPYHKALDTLSERFAALCCTEDAEEGVKAFLEKRKPDWRER
jgi:enoyl-CoA hydratase/carnithine racemase